MDKKDRDEPMPTPAHQPQQYEQPVQPSTSKQYILYPDYRDDFIDIIKKKHSANLQITSKSKTVSGIKGSNYEDIADYLTNKKKKKTAGHRFCDS